METSIIITGHRQHQSTGHITVTVKTRTVDGSSTWDGPEVGYGVDAVGFSTRFNNDMDQFEAWIALQHQQYIGANTALLEGLEKRKGKVIAKVTHV